MLNSVRVHCVCGGYGVSRRRNAINILLAILYYAIAGPAAYLIIDVCGYVLLQGSHGILDPQVGVGPEQRLIRCTVAQQQEYTT